MKSAIFCLRVPFPNLSGIKFTLGAHVHGTRVIEPRPDGVNKFQNKQAWLDMNQKSVDTQFGQLVKNDTCVLWNMPFKNLDWQSMLKLRHKYGAFKT